MKRRKQLPIAFIALFCALAGILVFADSIYAAEIASTSQAKKKALKKIPNATVTDVDQDYEDGVKVYDVELVKGNTKYDIVYRASDGKMLEYGWEKISVSADSKKALISESKCKEKAKKKVKGAKIISCVQKTDDGIDIYKLKMSTETKRYTLVYHARTGALLEYEWKLVLSEDGEANDGYIGLSKAKEIALDSVPGGTVVKAELDMDDGIPVYEVEVVKGDYEYEFKIHAETGEILEKEKDWND